MKSILKFETAFSHLYLAVQVSARTCEALVPRPSGTSGVMSGWWHGNVTEDWKISWITCKTWKRSRTLIGMNGERGSWSTTTTSDPGCPTWWRSWTTTATDSCPEKNLLMEFWKTNSFLQSLKWIQLLINLIMAMEWLIGENSWLPWDRSGQIEVHWQMPRELMTRSKGKLLCVLASRSLRSSKLEKESIG